jgi:hypothetical protein
MPDFVITEAGSRKRGAYIVNNEKKRTKGVKRKKHDTHHSKQHSTYSPAAHPSASKCATPHPVKASIWGE